MICDGPNKFRLLLGRESLLFQGFPVAWMPRTVLDNMTNNLLLDIAGNMAPVPVLLGLAMAFFASVSWLDTSDRSAGAGEVPPTSEREMEEAMAAAASVSTAVTQEQGDKRKRQDSQGPASRMSAMRRHTRSLS